MTLGVTPRKNRGRSARDRRTVRQSNAQIFSWMWAQSSSPPSSFPPRPETSGARLLAPPSPPSVDLPPPATILRFLAREPSQAPPPPSPTPSPASPRPESPNHRRSPLEALEALLHRRSASPVILRSNRPREWNHGESLVPLASFPLLLCATGAGERSPVAKMASHAIFQYNVLVIDIDNTTLGLI